MSPFIRQNNRSIKRDYEMAQGLQEGGESSDLVNAKFSYFEPIKELDNEIIPAVNFP